MHLSKEEFLSAPGPIVDLRSPAEFALGHLPDAVHHATEIRGHDTVRCYCASGVRRSAGYAAELARQGISVAILDGGYAGFRRDVERIFDAVPVRVFVLAGETGVGKTAVLRALAAAGEQCLDLEDAARHRGSVFGNLEGEPQPTNQNFQNEIAVRWLRFDPAKPVWIEKEAEHLGSVGLPRSLSRLIAGAPHIQLSLDSHRRLERILEAYRSDSLSSLERATAKLRPRLGDGGTAEVLTALRSGNKREAATRLLDYYDTAYRSREQGNASAALELAVSAEPAATAAILRCWAERTIIR